MSCKINGRATVDFNRSTTLLLQFHDYSWGWTPGERDVINEPLINCLVVRCSCGKVKFNWSAVSFLPVTSQVGLDVFAGEVKCTLGRGLLAFTIKWYRSEFTKRGLCSNDRWLSCLIHHCEGVWGGKAQLFEDLCLFSLIGEWQACSCGHFSWVFVVSTFSHPSFSFRFGWRSILKDSEVCFWEIESSLSCK